MEAEKTVVVLPDDVLRAQEVVERPLLAECPDVSTENGSRERTEVSWLIYGDKEVLNLQGLELEIAGLGGMAELGGVERVVWVPSDRAAIFLSCQCTGKRS